MAEEEIIGSSGETDLDGPEGALPRRADWDPAKMSMRSWGDYVLKKFRYERQLQSSERHERNYDNRIYDGEQFIDDELARAFSKYADLRTNMVRRPVDYLISIAASRNIEGRVFPAGGAFDADQIKMIADAYDKRLKSVQHFCKFRRALNAAIKDAAVVGEGYLHEGLVTADDGKSMQFFIKHVDWRNIWLDSKCANSDLSDARHLFYLRRVQIEEALDRFPSKAEPIAALRFDPGLSSSILDYEDRGYPSFGGSGGGNFFDNIDSSSHYEDTEVGNAMVVMGQAYIRRYNASKQGMNLYRCQFVMDETLTKMAMLKVDEMLYEHNRIPFSRIVFSRFGKTKQPYSPLTRNRRGFEKAMTNMLRITTRMAASRGVSYNATALREAGMGKNAEEYHEELRREAAMPAPVFAEYGAPGTLRMINLSVDMDKMMRVFDTLANINDQQSGISPELMGKSAPNIAGVAMEMKREESMHSFPDFMESVDNAVEGVCERMLALMSQYATEIEYRGILGPAGDLAPIEDDNSSGIPGTRATYQIVAKSGSKILLREQANMIMPVLQKMDGSLSASFMPAIIEMLEAPDSQRWKRVFIEILQMHNIPVASSLLSEEERQQAQQAAQEQQAKAEEERQLMVAQAQADISETETKSDKNKASALKDAIDALVALTGDEGENEMDEEARKTIRKLQAEYEIAAQNQKPEKME